MTTFNLLEGIVMPYFITDTETTGLEFGAEIVELAYLEIAEDLSVISEYSQRFKPQNPISAAASAQHGIVIEDLVDCPLCREIPCLMDVDIIGHFTRFDMTKLERFWDFNSHLCTYRAATQLFPDSPDHKLQTLKYYLGLRKDLVAHGALADVLVTYELLQKMLEITQLPLSEFIEECNKPVKYEVMTFGKHKGTKIRDLPRNYIKWLSTLEDPYGDWELTFRGLL